MQSDITLLPRDLALPQTSFAGSLEQIDQCPPDPGCYIIWLHLGQPAEIKRPRITRLAEGWYIYAGTAKGPGGLRARIRRHLQTDKKIRWHIDQISTQADRSFAWGWDRDIWRDGSECKLIEQLSANRHCSSPIRGFGSSDCRDCLSHLMICKAQLIDGQK